MTVFRITHLDNGFTTDVDVVTNEAGYAEELMREVEAAVLGLLETSEYTDTTPVIVIQVVR